MVLGVIVLLSSAAVAASVGAIVACFLTATVRTMINLQAQNMRHLEAAAASGLVTSPEPDQRLRALS